MLNILSPLGNIVLPEVWDLEGLGGVGQTGADHCCSPLNHIYWPRSGEHTGGLVRSRLPSRLQSNGASPKATIEGNHEKPRNTNKEDKNEQQGDLGLPGNTGHSR